MIAPAGSFQGGKIPARESCLGTPDFQLACCHGIFQAHPVLGGLVSVAPGKGSKRVWKFAAPAHLPGNPGRIAATSVGLGQHGAAQLQIITEDRSGEILHLDAGLVI